MLIYHYVWSYRLPTRAYCCCIHANGRKVSKNILNYCIYCHDSIQSSWEHYVAKYVCSIAKPLHYYALRVPRKADRWRWVWSIFGSRTAWADHIVCGKNICLVYWRKLRLGWLYGKCLCDVIVLWSVEWWREEGRMWNPVPTHSTLFSKSTKGAARLNVLIRRTNLYQQYYVFSIYITAEGFGI